MITSDITNNVPQKKNWLEILYDNCNTLNIDLDNHIVNILNSFEKTESKYTRYIPFIRKIFTEKSDVRSIIGHVITELESNDDLNDAVIRTIEASTAHMSVMEKLIINGSFNYIKRII